MFGVKEVIARLEILGYEAKKQDEQALAYCVKKISDIIKNKIHSTNIPAGLEHVAVDMAVGEFLNAKKTFAPEDITSLNLDCAVKQIQEGDTNIVFATGEGSLTAEQRLDRLINYLMTYGLDEIVHYRRLVW